MGFAICCLLCDAVDEAGSVRCRTCISSHEMARERIGRGTGGPIEQLARDLLAFTTEPHRHDHDEMHGPLLRRYVRLLAAHAGERPPPTQDEVEALFAEARLRVERNALRDAANQNPWRDAPPAVQDAREMLRSLPVDTSRHDGARTVPSRPIGRVDRSERPGEDAVISDRVKARADVEEAPEALREPFQDLLVEQSGAQRQKFSDLLDEVGDLLDD